MVDASRECHLWRLERVVGGEVDGQEEDGEKKETEERMRILEKMCEMIDMFGKESERRRAEESEANRLAAHKMAALLERLNVSDGKEIKAAEAEVSCQKAVDDRWKAVELARLEAAVLEAVEVAEQKAANKARLRRN